MTIMASRVGKSCNELSKTGIIFLILIFTLIFISIGNFRINTDFSQDWRDTGNHKYVFSIEKDVSSVENVGGNVRDHDAQNEDDDEGPVLTEGDIAGFFCGVLFLIFFVFIISYKLGKRKGHKNAMAEIQIRDAQRGIVATPLSQMQTRESMAPKYGLACAQQGTTQQSRQHQQPQAPPQQAHQPPAPQQAPPQQVHQPPAPQPVSPPQRPPFEAKDFNIPGLALHPKYGIGWADHTGPSGSQGNGDELPIMHLKYGLPCRNAIGIESYQELAPDGSAIPGIVEPVLTVRYAVTCKRITEMNRSMDIMENARPAQGPVMNIKYGMACLDLLGPEGVQGISGNVQAGAEPVMTVKYGYACNQISQSIHNLDGKGDDIYGQTAHPSINPLDGKGDDIHERSMQHQTMNTLDGKANDLFDQSRIPETMEHLDGKGDNGIMFKNKPSESNFSAGRVVCAHCNNAIILGEDIRDCPICHQQIR